MKNCCITFLFLAKLSQLVKLSLAFSSLQYRNLIKMKFQAIHFESKVILEFSTAIWIAEEEARNEAN